MVRIVFESIGFSEIVVSETLGDHAFTEDVLHRTCSVEVGVF
jgi:hypothetical protein